MCNCQPSIKPDCNQDIPISIPVPLPPCPQGEACDEMLDAGCVVYTNEPLPNVNVKPNDRLNDIIRKWAQTVLTPTQAIATNDSKDIHFSGNGQTLTPLEAGVILNPDPHNLIYKTDEGLISKVTLCLIQDFVSIVIGDSKAHQLFCDLVSTCAAGFCGSATDLNVKYIDTVLRATWIPFTANATSQVIQYKKLNENQWTSLSTVGAYVNTIDIPGILPNTIYMVRIQTNCYINGPAFNTPFIIPTYFCPAVVFAPSYDALAYSFKYIPNDFTKLTVSLQKQSDNSIIGFKEYQISGATAQDLSGSFPDLEPATIYLFTITQFLSAGDQYTKPCPSISVTTIAPPSCNIPGALHVELGS